MESDRVYGSTAHPKYARIFLRFCLQRKRQFSLYGTMQNVFLYWAGAKGDGPHRSHEVHRNGAQRFFSVFKAGHTFFSSLPYSLQLTHYAAVHPNAPFLYFILSNARQFYCYCSLTVKERILSSKGIIPS